MFPTLVLDLLLDCDTMHESAKKKLKTLRKLKTDKTTHFITQFPSIQFH